MTYRCLAAQKNPDTAKAVRIYNSHFQFSKEGDISQTCSATTPSPPSSSLAILDELENFFSAVAPSTRLQSKLRLLLFLHLITNLTNKFVHCCTGIHVQRFLFSVPDTLFILSLSNLQSFSFVAKL